MAIPILAGERVLGVLDVQSDVPGRFTQEDIAIQTTLAAQVAVALENARLFQQVQHQADQEALINSISQKIQSTTTVETALQVAIRELGRALGAQRTSVHLDVTRKAPTGDRGEAADLNVAEPYVAGPNVSEKNAVPHNGPRPERTMGPGKARKNGR
jgi:GAF domain-containing protein